MAESISSKMYKGLGRVCRMAIMSDSAIKDLENRDEM